MTPSDLTGLPDNILRKMVEEARAEAARQALLVQRYEPAYLGLPHVVRERDEARAEAEVGALQQLAEIRLQESMRQEMAKEQAEAEVERLREALVLVAEWKMPDTVGRDGKPSTYGLEYGSNGERDYVRGIARAALRGGGK